MPLKIILTVMLVLSGISAFAYEISNSYYAGIYGGYKIFDDKINLEDNPELGLKFGYYFSEHIGLEATAGYVDTEDNDNDDDQTIVTPGIHALYLFRPETDLNLIPYLHLGAESRIADHTLTGVAAGGGLRYLFTKHIGADVDYKHIYFGEARHDNLVSLSINFMFGVKEKQAAKVEPLPEPVAEVAVVKEEPVAEPAVKNKEPEAMVVLAPVDTDGDGVFDEYDKCPDTMTGTVVNADGCFKSMKLEVYFKTNSDEIDTASMHKVEAFAAFLKRNSVLNVEIQGHTDSRGDENYNLDLSRRRAASVSAALSDKFGIEKNRLSSKGYGETAPVATNETPEGRALNRRIEAVAVDDAGGVVESQKK